MRWQGNEFMTKYKYKIGVMGSAGRDRELPKKLLAQAREIGKEIAKAGCVLITGACMGLPQEAALGAGEENGLCLGISPSANLKEHTSPPMSYPAPLANMIHIYTGFGREGRNVITIRTCDVVIFIAGRVGALNEFSIAYQLGKVIGILKGSGGISDKIPEIVSYINKPTGAILIYENKPKELVRKVIKAISCQS